MARIVIGFCILNDCYIYSGIKEIFTKLDNDQMCILVIESFWGITYIKH